MRKAKILLAVLLLFSCFALCSCSSGEPTNVSEDMYNAAKIAVDIADNYLDGRISIEEADKNISRPQESASRIMDELLANNLEPEKDGSNEKDFSVYNAITSLSSAIGMKSVSLATDSDIEDARNELAALINMKSR